MVPNTKIIINNTQFLDQICISQQNLVSSTKGEIIRSRS